MKRTSLLFVVKLLMFITTGAIVVVVATGVYFSFFPLKEHYSVANICINNLRNIDKAKYIWVLKFNKSSNEIPTWDDIKPFLDRDKPYFRFDSNGLPVCPSGGTYTIGKIGEQPTCSIGTNRTPAHFLP